MHYQHDNAATDQNLLNIPKKILEQALNIADTAWNMQMTLTTVHATCDYVSSIAGTTTNGRTFYNTAYNKQTTAAADVGWNMPLMLQTV
jgi:hypothetical protein